MHFAICRRQQLMSSCTLSLPPSYRNRPTVAALSFALLRVPTSKVTGNVEMVPPTAWSCRSNDGKLSPSQVKRALNFGTLESCHSHCNMSERACSSYY
jgi:hypothetical protein